jgi:nitrite reductase (NADH) small subunit/3-phenylpropionate/trans-cinnamate dioxygenase ferredoxin subunit
MDNICPHAGGPLAEGEVENGCVICPWHYWSFRVENGELANAPAVKVKTYPARVHEFHGSPKLVQADLPMY